jgi:hypothetical protein
MWLDHTMKKIVVAAVSIGSLFLGSVGNAQMSKGSVPKQNGNVGNKLTPQQQQQLLGEVIGVGIAGAVIGAAINEGNHRRPNGNGWNNNGGWNNVPRNGWNNNGNWNNNNGNWNNNNGNWNNNNNWSDNNGIRYNTNTSSSTRPQQSTVYRNGYPVEQVSSSQPVYSSTVQSSTVQGERIISPGTIINGERVISSSPVISGEQIISSGAVISGERVISSSPASSAARAVSAAPVKENSLPYKGPGVSISLDMNTGGSVTYLIDGVEEATIEAGQQQTLSKKGKYEIRFSRGRGEDGTNFGEARYTITEGEYSFSVTDKGWELQREKDPTPTAVAAPSPSGLKTNALPPKTSATKTPSAAGLAGE